MSKQSEAKRKQGYVQKAEPQLCENCSSMKFNLVFPEWIKKRNEEIANGRYSREPFGEEYKQQKNIRCGIGGFAVKKYGTCDEWIGK